MSPQQYEHLARLVADPPKGSRLAAAKEYGVDLTLLLESLWLTPTERLMNWMSVLAFHDELRRAAAVHWKND